MNNVLHSKYRFALAGGVIGLGVSLSLLLFFSDFSDWMLYLWPTMFGLLALQHPGITLVIGVTTLILMNAALYAAIGHLLSLALSEIGRAFRQRNKRARRGSR